MGTFKLAILFSSYKDLKYFTYEYAWVSFSQQSKLLAYIYGYAHIPITIADAFSQDWPYMLLFSLWCMDSYLT